MYVVEIFFIISYSKLSSKNIEIIYKNFDLDYANEHSARMLNNIKIQNIKKSFNIEVHEFLDKAKELTNLKNIYLENKHSVEMSEAATDTLSHIFNKEAIPRFLTLMLFFASILSIVFITQSKNSKDVILGIFSTFNTATFFSWLVVATAMLFLFIGLQKVGAGLRKLYISITLYWNKEKAKEMYFVNYFLKDLVSLHRGRPKKLEIRKASITKATQ